jgi:type I restriction enzyme S subunit
VIENTFARLPTSWVWTKLNEISETTSGGTPSRRKKEYFGGNIPWLKSGELNKYVVNSAEEAITEDGLTNSSAKIIPSGTLLIALYGATVGKLGILGIDAAINQAICAISPYEGVSGKFLFWYLTGYREELLNIRKGGAQPNISQEIVREIPIPLPPFGEQVRVVARLEELFTRLDAGVEGLRKVKAQLKRYRQAVLKTAISGKLTENWREEHRHELLSEPEFFERKQNEKLYCKSSSLIGSKKIPQPDLSRFAELPKGWICQPLIEVATLHRGYDLPDHKRTEGPYPVVASSSIVGYHNMAMVEGPGVVTGRSGTIGEVVYVETAFWPLNTTLYVCDFHNNNPKFIKYLLEALLLKQFASGTGVPTLNRNLIHPLPVPVPQPLEQNRIVEVLEPVLSMISHTEKDVGLGLMESKRLRQSILTTALKGRLVAQDPNDEPAEKLLERIKAERAKSNGEKDTNRRRKDKPRQLELSTYVK